MPRLLDGDRPDRGADCDLRRRGCRQLPNPEAGAAGAANEEHGPDDVPGVHRGAESTF